MDQPMQDSTRAASAAAAPSPPVKSNRSALLIVFLVVFIDLLGFGIVLPFLPRFSNELLRDLHVPGGKESVVGGLILGLLMSSFSLMQFLFSPMWGRISDRVGRRPILLLGLCSSAVFYALLGAALSLGSEDAKLALGLLFLSRIGAGVAGATIGTAQAVIADCTPPEHRRHGMALIGAAFGIGFTFGPLVGFAALTWLSSVHGAVGFVAAGLSVVALMLGIRLLPETRQVNNAPAPAEALAGGAGVAPVQIGSPPSAPRKAFDLQRLRSVLQAPTVGILISVFFLSTFGFASFEATLALYNQDILRMNEKDNFLIFAYVGFVLLLTQGFLYRRLAKRWGEMTFMVIGLLLMGAGVASLGAASYSSYHDPEGSILFTWVMIGLAIAVMGYAFLTPSIQALISRRSDPTRQGEVLGVNQSASAMARILGPLVGLSLYKAHPSHLLPYALGALLIVVMLPLLPRLAKG
jgi:MFS family permease